MKADGQPNDKKKVAILGALGLVLLGAGVFQLMPSSEPPKPPSDAKKPSLDAKNQPEPPKNPEYAFDLPARDPFDGEKLDDGKHPAAKTSKTAPVPPVDPGPLKGQIGETVGPLPPAHPAGETKSADKPAFNYTLVGIVVGDPSVAIFRDAAGGQRLIRQGGAIDPDATVVAIAKTGVTIVFRGSTLHLQTGGNTVAK